MLKEAAYYSRMTLGLMDLLRIPPSADPQGTLRKQMEGRTEGFLEQVREYVFGAPPHPYRAMFELAGCELGDLENMVRREGLEKTLHRLRDSGVYLLHDELKGKQPIVRGGREIPGNPDSFLKPGGGGRWTSQTGRSRSNGTSTAQSPAYRAHRNCYDAILAEEFALQERDCVMLFPILPAAYGFSRARSMYRSGVPVTRWFAVGGGLREAGHYRLVTRALVAEARLLGWPLPWPQFLDASDFMPVVRHLEEAGARGRKTLVFSVVSPAVRVAAAAIESGISLEGVLFIAGGEALTDAKREIIEQSGAQVRAMYIVSEVGTIGFGCSQMHGNCVHLFDDGVAAIAVERTAPLCDEPVQSLHFTTLLASNPRLLINAEVDDHGWLGAAACGCAFSRLGFRKQIDRIWSFSKLTGYGATLVGSDIVNVLERSLPQRFGGAPGDYQLVETDRGGECKLTLRVSPRTNAKDAEAVRRFFLDQVRGMFGGSLSVRDWRHAEAFSVALEEPEATSTGKVLSLHLLRSGDGGRSREAGNHG